MLEHGAVVRICFHFVSCATLKIFQKLIYHLIIVKFRYSKAAQFVQAQPNHNLSDSLAKRKKQTNGNGGVASYIMKLFCSFQIKKEIHLWKRMMHSFRKRAMVYEQI